MRALSRGCKKRRLDHQKVPSLEKVAQDGVETLLERLILLDGRMRNQFIEVRMDPDVLQRLRVLRGFSFSDQVLLRVLLSCNLALHVGSYIELGAESSDYFAKLQILASLLPRWISRKQNGKMATMRYLAHDNKLVARTAPEIVSWINACVDRSILRDNLEFRDRKVSLEAALNAIFLHFLDHDEEDQREILRTYVPAFESIMEENSPVERPPCLMAYVKGVKPREAPVAPSRDDPGKAPGFTPL
jgi:hypothetical protein